MKRIKVRLCRWFDIDTRTPHEKREAWARAWRPDDDIHCTPDGSIFINCQFSAPSPRR